MRTYMGIDPGQSGGIAAIAVPGLEAPGASIATAIKMPDTLKDIFEAVKGDWTLPYCFIELVHSMPKQGVASTFKFGKNFGNLEMALTAAGIPFEYVTPTKWQKVFGLAGMNGISKTEKKNRHKAKAQQLFPSITITHANADALLIAEYCRRVREGLL